MSLIPNGPRLLLRAPLIPLQGERFQPTGFPDIGAGTYQLADGTEMLLVESEQSVANRLEAVCFEPEGSLAPVLQGLPYVEVHVDGDAVTNSMQEAHRLNSVYVEKSDFFETLTQAIGHDAKKPADLRRLAKVLLRYDPASLLHGTFLESIAGTLRLPRAVSGFVEARDVRPVATGGVKNDRVTPATEKGSDRTAKEGYGNVPFHRDAYTASEISAYFNLDLSQIRSYGFSPEANELLVSLALWKIHVFLSDGLRLRTACDFGLAGPVEVQAPHGYQLPTRTTLEEAIPRLIASLAAAECFAAPPVSVANYQGK